MKEQRDDASGNAPINISKPAHTNETEEEKEQTLENGDSSESEESNLDGASVTSEDVEDTLKLGSNKKNKGKRNKSASQNKRDKKKTRKERSHTTKFYLKQKLEEDNSSVYIESKSKASFDIVESATISHPPLPSANTKDDKNSERKSDTKSGFVFGDDHAENKPHKNPRNSNEGVFTGVIKPEFGNVSKVCFEKNTMYN